MIKKIMSILWRACSNLQLYVRSKFWRRDFNTILVGGWFGEKFADNSRYLYQYLFYNKKKLNLNKVIWVTHNKNLLEELNKLGYECYMMYSKESIYYHKHAGIHIVCNKNQTDGKFNGDIEGKYSYGAKRINLWHGVSAKGVGLASNTYQNNKRKYHALYIFKDFLDKSPIKHILNGAWAEHYVLCTSIFSKELMEKTFGLRKQFYIVSSYPRNCSVPFLLPKEIEILNLMKDFRYVVLYLPTFRSDNEINYQNYQSILKQTLVENDILLIQKPHSAATQNIIKNCECDNIINLPSSFDINVLLPEITLLITDYSSVMSDAMFHNKPVLYLVPDYNEYKKGDRGFVIDPEIFMCGPMFYDIHSLNEKLAFYCVNPEKAKTKEYNDRRTMIWGEEIKSLEDICKDILDSIK